MNRIFPFTMMLAAVILGIGHTETAFAVINGPCSGCHTMHNSQNDQPMRFDAKGTPMPQLLRGDCYGCHAQGNNQALFAVGVDVIPQVYHTDTVDLAGGNFAYIDGTKPSPGGASDSKGHNIADLWSVGTDATLYGPPGGIVQSFHDTGYNVNTTSLRCAGTNGCHGNRYYVSPYEGITGAHHNNTNGAVTQGAADAEPGHGYRFLVGVNGYEDTDWQYTRSGTDHNEYAGRSTPVQLGCSGGAVLSCHGTGGIRPPSGTMAEYCGTCHGNFHTLATASSSGVAPNLASPFIRHPSDFSLPGTGEYVAYKTYLINTPVARIGAVPATPSEAVNPGADAVFCLSCHVAHASPYPDMLKWDYATMQVNNGGAAMGTGCFACHSAKD